MVKSVFYAFQASLLPLHSLHPGGLEGLIGLGRKSEPGSWRRVHLTAGTSGCATRFQTTIGEDIIGLQVTIGNGEERAI